MTTNVSREQAFSVLATNFSISPSSSGYTLQVSADGVNYSDLFAVGANVTRMVTGVASGSFYKLRGNTDTNVIINWERQCNDGQGGGGGSEYILPAATQSTLGGVKVGAGLGVEPDGELWVDADSIMPAMDRLKRVIEFPPDANIGDAVAKIRQEDEEIITEGVQFTDGIDLTGKQTSYIYVNDANGVEFSFNGGRWSISWANETFNLNLVDGADNITGAYSIVTKGDSESGWDINIQDGDENLLWNMFIDKVYEINDYGFGSDYTVPAGREGTVNYKEVVTKDIPEGVYQYDGTDWVKSGIVNLDNLNGTGREGEIYEYNGRFFKWVEGAGATGKWLGANIGNANYNSSGESVHSLIYTQLPTNILLCVFRRIGTDVAYLAYDGNNLVVYSDETLTTTIDTIYPNETEHHLVQNGNWYITWVDGLLTIRTTTYSGVLNKRPLYDSNPHFVALDIDTLAHPTNVTTSDSDSGLPVWNKEGVIIGKNGNLNVYRMKINSTGWTGSRNFYAPETYATESWYFPKQGGTAGQVLTSAGDAEPQWATIIKAQQISSAAYEALAVKDPNTLYLIVD